MLRLATNALLIDEGGTIVRIEGTYQAWNYKPVAFISYGGMSGGMRSVQMAKEVVTTLKMVPLPEAVNIHMVPKYIHDGQFVSEETYVTSLKKVLVELTRWAGTSLRSGPSPDHSRITHSRAPLGSNPLPDKPQT
jgi:NAD(P)H-dependent FMN reductase